MGPSRPPVVLAPQAAHPSLPSYLVKKGLLDPAKVERATSKVWDVLERKDLHRVPGISVEQHQHSISPGISRHDPETWVGASANHDGDHPSGLRSLGHLPWMLDLVPYDEHVRAMATAFLGPLRGNRRTRGVYPVFPQNNDHMKHGAQRGSGVSASELGVSPSTPLCCAFPPLPLPLRWLWLQLTLAAAHSRTRTDRCRNSATCATCRTSRRAAEARHFGLARTNSSTRFTPSTRTAGPRGRTRSTLTTGGYSTRFWKRWSLSRFAARRGTSSGVRLALRTTSDSASPARWLTGRVLQGTGESSTVNSHPAILISLPSLLLTDDHR